MQKSIRAITHKTHSLLTAVIAKQVIIKIVKMSAAKAEIARICKIQSKMLILIVTKNKELIWHSLLAIKYH